MTGPGPQGTKMYKVDLDSVRDTLFVGLPLIVIVAAAVFRLDGLFTTSRTRAGTANRRRPGCVMDEKGDTFLVDPDGRPSGARTRSK